jgi:hypothetical protein
MNVKVNGREEEEEEKNEDEVLPGQDKQPSASDSNKDNRAIDLRVNKSDYEWNPRKKGFGTIPTKREWDPESLPDDFCCILYGMRRTGKSFMMRHILYLKRDKFPFIIVFTKTKMNGFWQKIVPEEFIHEGYQPSVLQRTLDHQRKILSQSPDIKEKINFRILFIFDDVISDQNLMRYDHALSEMFTAGRHYNTATLFATQDPKGVSTYARGNTDVVMIFLQKTIRAKKSLYDDYMSSLSFEEAKLMMRTWTKDRHCIVVDTSKLVEDPEDLFYTWKASETEDFVGGCKEYWDSANKKNEPK